MAPQTNDSEPPGFICRQPSSIGSEIQTQSRQEFYRELHLTKSKVEKVDTMIDREVRLRLEVALLEAEALEKQRAAQEALMRAMNALNEVRSGDEGDRPVDGGGAPGPVNNTKDERASAAAARSINGTIDEIARLMKETDDNDDEGRDGGGGPASPPPIVRRTGEECEAAAAAALQIATSNLTADRNHEEMMDDTLDVIMFKIEECTAVISDPSSTVEDQMSAAKLVSQYAKAAKAFQEAAY